MPYLAAWRSQSTFNLKEAWLAMNPPRVLLAEDDTELREFLASALRSDGYDVVEAEDGTELLDALATGMLRPAESPSCDIVISDIRMRGKTGLEVLAGLRQTDWSTPVILITGYGDVHTQTEAERLGAAAVFDKPFDIDDLRTAVLNLVKPH
jgi:DNA-binding NtrC family response regulator